ncbi:MAG TPA: universal stress protein [Spirochaetota bacterium]|nr:universal stress protein [Spirochaetota bacterium]HPJ33509.1 universal stress protein [Spirochaetota bacterium]
MADKKPKFLVAIGFSERPQDVLEKAVDVASKYKAHVYILHVITEMPKLTFYYDAYRLWENFRDSAVVEAADILKKHIAKMKNKYRDIEPVVEVGEPGTVILDKAEELDVDLIIMGHHVRKGLNHVMHQNSCERVVRYSKRPVLTFYVEKDEE